MTKKIVNQIVFDEALKHIRKQGKPSIIKGSLISCRYKNPEGLGCAFAPCIEKYDKKLEGRRASHLVIFNQSHLYEWARNCDHMVVDHIQRAHDRAAKQEENFLELF